MFNILQEIFQNYWLIHHDSAKAYLPHLIAAFKGVEFNLENQEIIERNTPGIVSHGKTSIVKDWELSEIDIPENSIAIIPIKNVIRKYGWSGTAQIQQRIAQAEGNQNIIAILFWFETPGGMVTNTDLTAIDIKNCKKPTVGFASQMVASAGMWLYSACDYRILSSPLDRIGSIGTMASLTDLRGLEEKFGIKVIDLYASLSTNKNNEIRELLENNNSAPIVETLDFMNAAFHAAIRENLGLNDKSPVFTGEIYFAEEGVKQGLANEINTLSYAIEKAYQLGLTNSYVNN